MKCAAALTLLLLLASAIAPAQERCGIAKDLMIRALERLSTVNAPASEVEDGVQLLKRASSECASLGDAWYYRSLFEKKVGHQNLADFALRQAKLVGSQAMDNKADPFHLAAPPRPGEKPNPAVHDKWALVVGISRFKDPTVPKLTYTAPDAEAFAAALKDPMFGKFKPDHVHLVTGEGATRDKIMEELNWMARMAGEEDLLVVYISGHGSSRNQDIADASYVITYDTETRDPINSMPPLFPCRS